MTITSPSAALVQLQAFYVAVNAANAIAPIAAEARAGNRTRLSVVQTYLARLGPTGELGAGLANGTVTQDRWLSVANVQATELDSIAKGLKEDNLFSRFWGEVVIPTGVDVGTTVKDAAAGTGFGVGVVLAAVIAAKVLR